MSIGLLRLRLLIAEHGRTLMWGLLITGLVAFAASGWVYANPPTEPVTEQVDQQTITSSVNTSATVRKNSTLWDPGTQLTNRPVFPMTAPVLELTLETAGPPNEQVRVEQQLTLTFQATRNGDPFWRVERDLISERTTTTDGSVVTTVTLDIPAIRAQLDRYNDDLTGLGQAEVILSMAVDYETQHYTGTLAKSTGLIVGANGYWLDEPLAAKTSHSKQVTTQVEAAPNGVLAGGLGGLGLLAVAGAGGIWYYREQDPNPLAIQERLDRGRFEEWISEGTLEQPISARDVPVASLGDLVDIAIDSNKRVIHDPARQRYAVMDGQVAYRFDPYEDPAALQAEEASSGDLRETIDDDFDDAAPESERDAWNDLLADND